LELYDFGGLAPVTPAILLAEMLVAEVLVAEVFTQGRLLLLNSRGIVMRKRSERLARSYKFLVLLSEELDGRRQAEFGERWYPDFGIPRSFHRVTVSRTIMPEQYNTIRMTISWTDFEQDDERFGGFCQFKVRLINVAAGAQNRETAGRISFSEASGHQRAAVDINDRAGGEAIGHEGEDLHRDVLA
jgi:hypothetical protein